MVHPSLQNCATKTDGGLTPPERLFLSKPVLLGKLNFHGNAERNEGQIQGFQSGLSLIKTWNKTCSTEHRKSSCWALPKPAQPSVPATGWSD
jgi:hypothetical protein